MKDCDALGVHKSADVWMFDKFLQDPAKEILILRVTSPETFVQDKDGKITNYSDVFIYLLDTYASEDVIEEAEGNLRRRVHMTCMIDVDYSMLLSK